MKKLGLTLIMLVIVAGQFSSAFGQTEARKWNDVLLECIRNDYARPTVHARNLFHVSMGMYDAWSVYDDGADSYFLGKVVDGFYCPFDTVYTTNDSVAAQNEALSYAAFRLLKHRFQYSPGVDECYPLIDSLFVALGYDTNLVSIDYQAAGAPALGNYIAHKIIQFGHQDGSNELNQYGNEFYEPYNSGLNPGVPGVTVTDPNRWQPLDIPEFTDQSGNVFIGTNPPFLSPEWGEVSTFSLHDSDMTVMHRDGLAFNVYHDPGNPPRLDSLDAFGENEFYKWGFGLVSIWSSHLDPLDGVMWDISPATIGNSPSMPDNYADYPSFYNLYDGGDNSAGYTVNPATAAPYVPQVVPRGDYARVLAEFWADGPDSETPPGHWFTLLNYVSDHAQFEKKWRGQGVVLDDLEWDVKAYFAMGGAMHDAAIAAWSIKGYYDYIRPISAIRFMGQHQAQDDALPNYATTGFEVDPGVIEIIEWFDPLANPGNGEEYTDEMKLKAWRGPDYISEPTDSFAGVDWIPAAKWWPYQRPNFVTPPFAGFVSGHSTYSRAAAELMTLMTGDAFFPGGMGEFFAEQDSFLVFEEGPSVDVTLQWATYRDASDQCSLSRIWGGIHPPADDIPGRKIGMVLGVEAFNFAEQYFGGLITPSITSLVASDSILTDASVGAQSFTITAKYSAGMDTAIVPVLTFTSEDPTVNTLVLSSSQWVNPFTCVYTYDVLNSNEVLTDIHVQITSAVDLEGTVQADYLIEQLFEIETENPHVLTVATNPQLIADEDEGVSTFIMIFDFNEPVDTSLLPAITFPNGDPTTTTLIRNQQFGGWSSTSSYEAVYAVIDADVMHASVDVVVSNVYDLVGNKDEEGVEANVFSIDMENPMVNELTVSADTITELLVGGATFSISVTFNEAMDTTVAPGVGFPFNDPLATSLTLNSGASHWVDDSSYVAFYDVNNADVLMNDIDVLVDQYTDSVGNDQVSYHAAFQFVIDVETGVASLEHKETLAVYPNPIQEGKPLRIDWSGATQGASIGLYSFDGKQLVADLTSKMSDDGQIVWSNNLSAGQYVVVVSSGQLKSYKRFSVVK